MIPSINFPTLRADIEIIEDGHDRALVFHQPSNKYFELPPEGVRLLSLFNGDRDYSTVQRKYNEGSDSQLSLAEIQSIAETNFRKFLRFPEHSAIEGEEMVKTNPNYLKLSRVLIPPHFISHFSRYLKVFFRPNVMVAVITTFVVALAVGIYQYWGTLGYYFEISPLANVTMFVVIMTVATLLHEFGHASACDYFGVEHGGIGVGFYLLSPVMFADVTAAWRLPAKDRIVINFAGMYFELLLGIVLLAALFITGNPMYLGFTLVCLFHLFFNLNPLFRTDGYWILSDWCNLPNLRSVSHETMRGVFTPAKRREYAVKEWLLTGYALTSYVFISMFDYFILFEYEGSLLNFGSSFTELYQSYQAGQTVTISHFFYAMQTVFIPLLFYYFLIKLAIIPLFKRLRRGDRLSGLTSSSFVLLLCLSTSLFSCDLIQIDTGQEPAPASSYTITSIKPAQHIAFATDNIVATHDSLVQQRQPIFMDFYADWCKPCRMMDKGTLSDLRVVDCLMSNYQAIKIDVTTPEGQVLRDQYNVTRLPTYLFIDPAVNKNDKLTGLTSIDRMLHTCSS